MGLNLTGDAGDPAKPTERRTGIAARVESASKMSAPAPKGKGIVLMLLGVVVLAALIHDFMGRGAASEKVREIDRQQGEAVAAPTNPDGDRAASPEPAGVEAVYLTVRDGGQELRLTPSAAIVYFTTAPADKQSEIRPKLLAGLAAEAGKRGPQAREVYELASHLLEGVSEESDTLAGPLAELTLAAIGVLENDAAAPAALLFLRSVPGGVPALAVHALDKVILERGRPLHVRIAAAEARPEAGRPERLRALAEDPGTHPALRAALR
ncbi:MAG: hypothetical protein O2894_06040 [Planctomycetota bacterium]|nr:hypothetical protein [Planctomycetota bacterium]